MEEKGSEYVVQNNQLNRKINRQNRKEVAIIKKFGTLIDTVMLSCLCCVELLYRRRHHCECHYGDIFTIEKRKTNPGKEGFRNV